MAMENSYFIYTAQGENLKLKRVHICSWEFSNNSTLMEFGVEIESNSILGKKQLQLSFFVPWLDSNASTEDFYPKLKDSSNSRFIFNDAIINLQPLDDGQNESGVIYTFLGKGKLCIVPVKPSKDSSKQKINVKVDLELYNNFNHPPGEKRPNVYFRFCIKPKDAKIFLTKKGISKSTILYDLRLNQKRNIPESLLSEILHSQLCGVETCFCLNIIPNTHDLVFFDNKLLQSVRTLEFAAFLKYLGTQGLKERDLLVVFNKDANKDSYTFFSMFSKEHIGADQLTIGLLTNLIVGILLFFASILSKDFNNDQKISLVEIHYTFWIACGAFILLLLYYINRRFNFIERTKSNK
jgi:hypothetical protein